MKITFARKLMIPVLLVVAVSDTQAQEALIENYEFFSEKEYLVLPGEFKKGAQLWTDRIHTARDVPEVLVGGTLIQTPMMDRHNQQEKQMSFTVPKDCLVYIGMKQGTEHPAWVLEWQKTDLAVEAGSNTMVFYRKAYPSGATVVIPGGRILQAMYTVVIIENPETDTEEKKPAEPASYA